MNMTKTGNSWSVTTDQTIQTSTYTFATKDTYSDGDIVLQVDVPSMTLVAGETFFITDPIATWTWTVDSSGNVVIT